MAQKKIEIIEDENLQNKPKKNKLILTLFITLFPSILIAGDYGLGFTVNLFLKAALIFYQYVLMKNILNDYYSYLGQEE